jgi:hypothetical protein
MNITNRDSASKFNLPEVEHAMGTLAAKSLGGPVSAKNTYSAIKTLYKHGLIPRVEMSAEEAYAEASGKKPAKSSIVDVIDTYDGPPIKSDRQLRIEADRRSHGLE